MYRKRFRSSRGRYVKRRRSRGRRYIRRFYKRARRGGKLARRTLPSSRKASRVHGTDGVTTGIVLVSIPIDLLKPVILDSLQTNHHNMYQGVMYIKPFPYPSPLTGDALTARDASQVLVKGFKIRRQFYTTVRSLTPNFFQPMVVNWCLMQPKNIATTEELQSDNTNRIGRILTENFFTDYSGSASRTRAWQNNTTTQNVWRYERNHLPINSKNNWRVITHQRKVVHPFSAGSDTAFGRSISGVMSQWSFKKYMKLNKVVSFAANENTLPEQPIYEFYWYEQVSPAFAGVIAPPPTQINTVSNHECYYANLP